MKLFECQGCLNPVHFDNTACVSCGRGLGYLPDLGVLSALEGGEADGILRTLADDSRRRFCDNAGPAGCNWMLRPGAGPGFCRACRHNRTIPDLSIERNLADWRKVEAAKRHLFYSLLRWNLPTPTRGEDPDGGLAFDFLADPPGGGTAKPVLTGHAGGVVTLNVVEADDAERERRRTGLGEPYRTVLGHFRHEIGHFYWERLVRGGGRIDAFRALFGDERRDYAEALAAHYATPAGTAWTDGHVSAYAAAHPWEDFAETFAHYVHMVDGLETGRSFGLTTRPRVRQGADLAARIDFDPYLAESAAEIVDAWVPFTVAMNAVNRSLGQGDLYPFVLAPGALEKIAFVHDLVRAAGREAGAGPAPRAGQGSAAVTMNSTL